MSNSKPRPRSLGYWMLRLYGVGSLISAIALLFVPDRSVVAYLLSWIGFSLLATMFITVAIASHAEVDLQRIGELGRWSSQPLERSFDYFFGRGMMRRGDLILMEMFSPAVAIAVHETTHNGLAVALGFTITALLVHVAHSALIRKSYRPEHYVRCPFCHEEAFYAVPPVTLTREGAARKIPRFRCVACRGSGSVSVSESPEARAALEELDRTWVNRSNADWTSEL